MTIRTLCLLSAMVCLQGQDTWTGVERIVAVGDVHGDYAGFVAVLRMTGVIDGENRWTGGRTHLVQTGDVLDRGPDSRKVMDLLMNLEKSAAKAGGRVHALIGNHEAMNLYGDLRYVSAGEFAAFRDDKSQKRLEEVWERESETMSPKPGEEQKAKWLSERPPGWVEHRLQFGPQGRYGRWIRSHKTIVKINDILFLHGGISPKFVDFDVRKINDAVRRELDDFSRMKEDGAVMNSEGPLWYRGLAAEETPRGEEELKEVLRSFGAKRIVIGHTPTPGKVRSLYGGRIVTIDVGLSSVYGGHKLCVVIEGENMRVVQGGERAATP